MSSRVSQILDSIESTLAFPIARGAREHYSTQDCPRVIAVVQGGRIEPSDRIGGQHVSGGKARQILIRQCGIRFTCWHATEEDAETLLHSTLAAVRKSCHNSVVFSDETWDDQAENEDGFERRGTSISFVATFNIPVFDTIFPVTGPLTHEHETLFGPALYGAANFGNCTYGAVTLFDSCL